MDSVDVFTDSVINAAYHKSFNFSSPELKEYIKDSKILYEPSSFGKIFIPASQHIIYPEINEHKFSEDYLKEESDLYIKLIEAATENVRTIYVYELLQLLKNTVYYLSLFINASIFDRKVLIDSYYFQYENHLKFILERFSEKYKDEFIDRFERFIIHIPTINNYFIISPSGQSSTWTSFIPDEAIDKLIEPLKRD